MKRLGFIYKTTNKINGKSYIGMCSDQDRFSTYLGSGIILQQAIEKYGKENFKREILEECEDEESLQEAEKKWIAYYDAVNDLTFYNLHPGGRGGYIPKKPGTMKEPVKKYWNSLTEEEYKERTKNMGKHDKSGRKNSRARKAIVNNKEYDCLKDALTDHPNIPYSSLKRTAQTEKPNLKYSITATYV